ncbi:MAG: hypothetical protein V5A38_00200 [Halolamina sp.]|uniref:hypothetical protein n=1 Tax=Halolamina sp. TaxID=1940283 RepID=UPI002FC3CBC7
MPTTETENAIYEAAREAIDEDALARGLEQIEDQEADPEAIAALHEITAESITRDILAADRHAKRRGRSLTADDIGDAADERRKSRCCPPIWHPTHLRITT